MDTKISRGAFGGQHFRRQQQGSIDGTGANSLLRLLKPEELPLFGPVGGDLKGQTHQPLCAEFERVFAVYDGRDDIGCQRRKTQQPRQVCLLYTSPSPRD